MKNHFHHAENGGILEITIVIKPPPTLIPESFEELREGFIQVTEDYTKLTEKYERTH